jgi:hypothetical protein
MFANKHHRHEANITLKDSIGDAISERALQFVQRKHRGAIKRLERD